MACVAAGCTSRMGASTENNQRISFHRFPKEPKVRDKWIKNINRKNWSPTAYSRLCALHFNESCYREGYQMKILHSDAVPTIFTHIPSYSSKRVPRRPRPSRPELLEPTASKKSVQEEILQLKATITNQRKIIQHLKKIAERYKITAERRGRNLKNMRQKYFRQSKQIENNNTVINELKSKLKIEEKIGIDKSKSTPNQYSGKSTLTSLLTTNATTPTGPKTVISTRRIMTKGADGTTRVVSQPITGPSKSTPVTDGAATPKAAPTPQKDGPQKVQIIRAPDGKIIVRGLLSGQQLIQTPDGKVHVVMAGQQGIAGQLVAASPSKPPEAATSESNDRPIAAKPVVEEPRPAALPRMTPQHT